MSDKKILKLVSELNELAEDGDADEIESFIQDCSEKGIELDLLEEEEIEWSSDDGEYEYATVSVEYTLKLGDVIVEQWTSDYMGEYGGGGTGWWITQTYTDISDEANAIVEAIYFRIESPTVPEPRKIAENIE